MELKKLLEEARKALAEKKGKRMQGVGQASSAQRREGHKAFMPAEAQKKLQKFGAKSMNDLLTKDMSNMKFGYIPVEEREEVKALKESVDIAIACSKIFDKPITELKFYEDELQYQLKTWGIDSGDGTEWIPTMVATSYIDEYLLPRKVSGLFQDVRMPSNPYKWPVKSQGAIARRVGLVAALGTAQVFKTDQTITFDSDKLTNQYALPEELNEDSAPDIVRAIRMELIEGQEKAMEIAILEGDTAAAMHYFTQLPDISGSTTIASLSTESPETSFDGIRVRVLAAEADVNGSAAVPGGGNAVTEGEMSALRQLMGKFAVNPADCAFISGVKSYFQLLDLDDVRTLEQYGPKATVLTGELGKYEGIPIVVSEYLREDCHTTGKNTSTTNQNITGTILLVNRKRWFTGTRRAIRVKVENNRTQYDVLDLVSFQRRAFQAVLKADGTNYAAESSDSALINIGF